MKPNLHLNKYNWRYEWKALFLRTKESDTSEQTYELQVEVQLTVIAYQPISLANLHRKKFAFR